MAGKRKRVYKTYRRRKKAKRMAKAIKALASTGLAFNGWARPSTNSIRVERKYIQFATSASALVSTGGTGLTLLCNGLNVGSGVSERIGRRVQFQSLYYKMKISLSSSTNAISLDIPERSPIPVRVIFFVDMQANGTGPTPNSLLDYTVTDIHPAVSGTLSTWEPNMASIVAPLNLDNRDRYRVLVDKTYVLEPKTDGYFIEASNVFRMPPTTIFREKFKRINIETTYNAGTDDGYQSISTNAIWCMILSGQNGGGEPAEGLLPYVSVMTRMRYTDA